MATVTTTIVRDFKDLDLNFTIHPVKKDINKNIGTMAIVNSIKNLILTNHYEKPFHPEIGSNVRRLLLTVKKYIASTSRYLVFEQNTSTTRNRFLNIVNPYLESIQQRQGLYAFKVVMDETNNTPDVVDRNIMKGAIYLQPTKTAEFIQIDFNILPTGASFTA